MLTKRMIRQGEATVRRQAHDNARHLAVAIAAGTAWAPPPYDLGIVLEPDEIVWHRCPAVYRWRGVDSCVGEQCSRCGHRSVIRHIDTARMFSLGMTDWLVTNLRLVARAPDGQVISI